MFNGISNSGDFDDEFLQRADTLYAQWSQELSDTGDEHNDQEDNTDAGTWNHLLNSRLDIEETIGALHRAKRDKSVGIDNIPNEIVKCSGLLHILHKLFHICFENNTIPSPWYQHVIKTMYANVQSAVRLHGLGAILTDWFSVHSGVRQGDNLAPTLFAMYINDFVLTINELHKGISIGDRDVSCLLYADDIVLLTETPVDLQVQLDAVNNWCRKWRLKINVTKTKIMHFRKNSIRLSVSYRQPEY